MLIEPSRLGPLESPREAREFADAKQRKREPIFLRGRGVGRGWIKPRSRAEFVRLRALLRGSRDFAKPMERLDALERELARYGAVGLPTPVELVQNENATLGVFFGDVSVLAADTGIVFLIGGTEGTRGNGLHPDLCRALAFKRNLETRA